MTAKSNKLRFLNFVKSAHTEDVYYLWSKYSQVFARFPSICFIFYYGEPGNFVEKERNIHTYAFVHSNKFYFGKSKIKDCYNK